MADIDLTTGSITIGDATFSKTAPIGAGTGNYDPFLTTHDGNANGQTNDGVAEGFNHDQKSILDTDDARTLSLKLSDMSVKLIDGVAYYEFRVDLNENNSAAGKLVSLNEFKLYTSASPATLADFNNTTDESGAGFTKVYDLDAGGDKTLILKDDNSGSGTDDYSVLIKASAFGNVDPAQTYVTLYVNMGSQSAPEDGGFEEWTTGGVADSNIDTSAPTQTVTISSITDDVAPTTGTVADGGTTNDTAPALAGTLSAVLLANEVLSIFRDGVKIGEADVAGTNWTFDDAGPLVDGTSYTYTARVENAANYLGPASNAYDITIDTTAPAAAVAITAITDDTGTPGDFVTSDTTLTVSGTHGALGADEKVQVSSDGGLTWSDVTTSDATTWSFTDPTPHASSFTYQARVIDAAANVGATDSQAVTIDTTAPTTATAHDDAFFTTENTVATGNVFADNGFGADSEPEGTYSVTAMSAGTLGTQLALPSGALLTLDADGTFSYDPNHRFDYLPTPGSGASDLTVTDTFTYTSTDGHTATVTVTVSGVDSNDILLDSAGTDTLAGGIGNDVYLVTNTADVVIEAAGAGFDWVAATVDYTLPASNTVEVLNMLGTGLTGTGSEGAETLISSFGANTLIGLGGDDVYYVQNTGDVVIEAPNGGFDWVTASVNYTLPAANTVEMLNMIGSGLTGTGSDGAETFISSGGPNTLIGLGGNDTYYVNIPADVVIEAANGGYDTVAARVDYTLPTNVEALYMVGSGLTGTGSDNADSLLSSGGPNTLIGLGGDDVYYVNNAADVVTEAANGGYDTVMASVSYTLPANVEALYVNGSGLTGTGSSGADTLVSLGANTLIGGDGDDTFVLFAGSANGATVGDFNRNPVDGWDFLMLSGFGTEEQGATISQIGSTDQWQIHSGLDGHIETITLSNHATPHAGDFGFV
jgi:VCBS repeat-containing protein